MESQGDRMGSARPCPGSRDTRCPRDVTRAACGHQRARPFSKPQQQAQACTAPSPGSLNLSGGVSTPVEPEKPRNASSIRATAGKSRRSPGTAY